MDSPLQLAIATAPFRMPLKESLKLAIEMRVSGVQLDAWHELRHDSLTESGRRQFLHHMEESGLRLTSLHLPLRRPLYDQTELDSRLNLIRQTMEFAWQLKAPMLTLRIGKIPSETQVAELSLLREVLQDLARQSTHIGTVLAIIPSLDQAQTLTDLLGSIQEGLLGIDFDPAGFLLAGDSPTKALQTAYKHVVHVQGRDAVREIDGTGSEAPVGYGSVDWREIVALLAEISYRGWVTVQRTQGDFRVAETERGLKFLRELLFV